MTSKKPYVASFRKRDISEPQAPNAPELPRLAEQIKFSWLKNLLFPGIQLAILGGGMYILFAILMEGNSFNPFYMIGFMALGMLSSTICACIEYFVSKQKNRKQNQKLTDIFLKDLEKTVKISKELGQDYADRLEKAYPEKRDFGKTWIKNYRGERTYDDHIAVRIGNSVKYPNPAGIRFLSDYGKHPLKQNIHDAEDQTGVLKTAPFLLDLDSYRCVSVIGKYASDFFYTVLAELMVCYAPERLRFYIFNHNKKCNLLPHITFCSVPEALDRIIASDYNGVNLVCSFDPNDPELEEAIGTADTIGKEQKKQVIFLIFNQTKAPAFSNCSITVNSENQAHLSIPFKKDEELVPELLNFDAVKMVISVLQDSPYKDIFSGKKADLPEKITLFEAFGFGNDMNDIRTKIRQKIGANWRTDHGKGISCTIGMGANGPVDLNFYETRGHGMVAGTTGSGKSQWLLSLCANLSYKYSPDFFNFAIIDFKGDATAGQLKDLPHFAGALSDLDGTYQLKRVLIMLESESKRRQAILNKAKAEGQIAVNEIEDYQKAFKTNPDMAPLPYLFIIVDEFVDAKQSDPKLIDDMEQIARQGRSRGIYLLLSAQNPAPHIGGQIGANIGYDICFKVRSKEISNVVIGSPVAADIEPSNRGRGYLFTDAGGLEEFQTAYAGEEVHLPGEITTQLDIFIKTVQEIWLGNEPARRVFEKPLPKEIVLTAGDLQSALEQMRDTTALSCQNSESVSKQNIKILLGLKDNIHKVELEPCEVSLSDGNIMIAGDPGMGKTWLLRSMVLLGSFLYSPNCLQFIVCSFSSERDAYEDLTPLKNVRHIITFREEELLMRLPEYLKRQIAERKYSMEAYPRLAILIDGIDILENENPKLAKLLMAISQIAYQQGITFVFSSNQIGVLPAPCRQNINTWISFKIDKDSYASYFPLQDIKVPTAIPGRALVYQRNQLTLETQFYTFFPSDPKVRTPRPERYVKLTNEIRKNERIIYPLSIPTAPEKIGFSILQDVEEKILPVGCSYEYPFSPVGFHFERYPYFVISETKIEESKVMDYMIRYLLLQQNYKVKRILYCDVGRDSYDITDDKLVFYGRNKVSEFFDDILSMTYDTNASEYTFIFLKKYSLMRSFGAQKATLLESKFKSNEATYLVSKTCFIFSDMAFNLTKIKTPVIPICVVNNGHGMVVGGSTENRTHLDAVNPPVILSDGFGYVYYGNDFVPVHTKLQNIL